MKIQKYIYEKAKHLKKGDVVTICEGDRKNGQQSNEVNVKTIGHKYITVDGMHPTYSKFETDTLYCKDWCNYVLFPGTKKEFIDYLIDLNHSKEILGEINKVIGNLPSDKLLKVLKYINEIGQDA